MVDTCNPILQKEIRLQFCQLLLMGTLFQATLVTQLNNTATYAEAEVLVEVIYQTLLPFHVKWLWHNQKAHTHYY